jgi:hypothetical protein
MPELLIYAPAEQWETCKLFQNEMAKLIEAEDTKESRDMEVNCPPHNELINSMPPIASLLFISSLN